VYLTCCAVTVSEVAVTLSEFATKNFHKIDLRSIETPVKCETCYRGHKI